MCTTEGIRGNVRCVLDVVTTKQESPSFSHPVLDLMFNPASMSFSLSQTLTEPAIFANETSCDCRAPHEKLTIAQARRGTPGTVDLLLRGFFL